MTVMKVRSPVFSVFLPTLSAASSKINLKVFSKSLVLSNFSKNFNRTSLKAGSIAGRALEKRLQEPLKEYEASKCPKVVVAQIDRRKLKNPISVNVELCSQICETDLAPSLDWEHQQIAMFSDLRRKVEVLKKSGKFKALPLLKLHNEDKWYNICFGDKTSSLEPSLTLLLSMGEPLLERVLEYQLEWLEEGLKPHQGKWIYALLACLSLPLTPVTCSVLRDLARQCAKIRCSESSLEGGILATLNLIICLVRKYFGQMDLMG